MVEWGGTNIGFMEVSGLDIEQDVIEYRDGASPVYSARKMAGIKKFSNITLKRGITKGDNEFYEWMSKVQPNDIERRDLVISLLDHEHNPVVSWKVEGAWPVRLEGPVLNASESEVAIETLELAHEGLTIEMP